MNFKKVKILDFLNNFDDINFSNFLKVMGSIPVSENNNDFSITHLENGVLSVLSYFPTSKNEN